MIHDHAPRAGAIICLTLAIILAAPASSRAQSNVQTPAQSQTELTLSASGEVTLPPDETAATLIAQSSASSAADAQAAVNQMVATALTSAARTAGLVATTGDYNVATLTDAKGQPTGYQASQTLTLSMPAMRGAPSKSFLSLIGHLQAQALQLQSLGADLSESGRARAQKAAILMAIHTMQDQASAIAASLGERVARIKTLSITDAQPVSPMPGGRMMVAMAAPVPQDQPGPIVVQANVSAVIELKP